MSKLAERSACMKIIAHWLFGDLINKEFNNVASWLLDKVAEILRFIAEMMLNVMVFSAANNFVLTEKF